MENVTEIKQDLIYPSIAHCAMHFIYHYGEVWPNSRIASEVKRIMSSNTGPGNISWYRVNLRNGKLDISKYVDTSIEPYQKEMKVVKTKIEIKPTEDLEHVQFAKEDAPNGIQSLAMAFVRERTESAFNQLYKRLKPGMINHAFGILKDQNLATDVANVAFAKIWTKIEQYNPYWCFSTWAYKIVKNEAMQMAKRNKQYSSMDGMSDNSDSVDNNYWLKKSGADEDLLIEQPNYFFDEEEDPKKAVYQKVLSELYELPRTYKDIMIDREINGMKYKDIAEKYGININSVKTRIKRARMQIIGSNKEYFKTIKKKKKKTVEEDENPTFDRAKRLVDGCNKSPLDIV